MTHIGNIKKYSYKDKLVLSLDQIYLGNIGTLFKLSLFSYLTNNILYSENFFKINEAKSEFERNSNEELLESYYKDQIRIITEEV